LIKQHRFYVALAISLSTQFSLVASSAAATVPYNGDVSLSSSNYYVSETGGSVTVTAIRAGGNHGALSVSYNTVSETALAGTQFTAVTGTLTWADGDSANKTIKIPILDSKTFTGTKWFLVRIAEATGTLVGRNNASVYITGTTTTVTKSIRGWVSCNESIDESAQLEQALYSAANNAFTLLVDCPVRFHTGTAAQRSIAVPDGVTILFQGAGEFLIGANGIPALTVAQPAEVTFYYWNLTYL
jgi:hypothetical protein